MRQRLIARCGGARVRGCETALACVIAALLLSTGLDAQRATRGRATQPVRTTEPAVVDCPSVLGEGVQTMRSFCDVLTGRDPAGGVIIKLPPHTGDVTLTFDLHNRHTYSEELIKSGRAYRQYTATIGILTADNTLLTRAIIQSEFRTGADLLDRVGGGAGPGGVKAVAPIGSEPISVVIPAAEQMVSILGERLTIDGPDAAGRFETPGRPVAIISNVQVQYRPGPARRAAPARR